MKKFLLIIKILNKSVSVKEVIDCLDNLDINKDGYIKVSEMLLYLIQKKV